MKLIIDKIKELKEKIKNVKFLEKNYLLRNMNHLEIYCNNKKEVEKNNNGKMNLNYFLSFYLLKFLSEMNMQVSEGYLYLAETALHSLH